MHARLKLLPAPRLGLVLGGVIFVLTVGCEDKVEEPTPTNTETSAQPSANQAPTTKSSALPMGSVEVKEPPLDEADRALLERSKKDDVPTLSGYGADWQTQCNSGNGSACAKLGAAFRSGRGKLPKNVQRAITLFKKACDAGDGSGCTFLGNAYAGGDGGLSKSEEKNRMYYSKGCTLGYPAACAILGRMRGSPSESPKGVVDPGGDPNANP